MTHPCKGDQCARCQQAIANAELERDDPFVEPWQDGWDVPPQSWAGAA